MTDPETSALREAVTRLKAGRRLWREIRRLTARAETAEAALAAATAREDALRAALEERTASLQAMTEAYDRRHASLLEAQDALTAARAEGRAEGAREMRKILAKVLTDIDRGLLAALPITTPEETSDAV